MHYQSTRGHNTQAQFCDILLEGLAPDGGLYIPQSWPQITRQELDQWRTLNYAELAFQILSRFVSDIPPSDLQALCQRTWNPQTYCHARATSNAADITPLHWLEPGKLALLELSNGPTLAFKDMAMQFLGNVFEYELQRRGQTLNILGATSGDTGSAAEYAMRGKKGIRVFMLSPHGKMSAFQRAQMYSLNDNNIFNIAVTGMFDDAQDIVKAVSSDHAFKAAHRIGAVNSINWARIAAQIIYYFKGYLAATRNSQEEVAFCVPTGNFGNVCAGHIARQMGLPIARLIVATNENDVLDEFFRTGCYRPRAAAQTLVTSSPSMDISKASNFERFVYDLLNQDTAQIAALWQQIDQGQAIDISASPDFARIADFAFSSGSSNHAQRLETIARAYERYQTLIDPHTADALNVAWQHQHQLPAKTPLIVLETAQPVKFSATLDAALGFTPPCPPAFSGIEDLAQHVTVLAPDVDKIKTFITQHTSA